MKITGFEVSELRIELKKPFVTALRRVECINDIVVKITTDTTLIGYGEACAVTAITGTTNKTLLKELNEVVFPALSEHEIEKIHIFERLHSLSVSPEAKACVDIALFDLLAKASRQSLHSYLGANHSSLQTDLTISVDDAAQMQSESDNAILEGFDILKIKLDADIPQNIQRLKQINEILPKHVKLRLDPNQSLDLEGCLQMLKVIHTDNIECIEQPFAADDLASMKTLKEKNIIPVLADESLFDAKDAKTVLEMDAADMLNIKLMKCGGIYEALKIARLAKEHHKSCMIGSMLEGPISLLAAVSFALSQKNITMVDIDSPLYLEQHPLLQAFNMQQDRINLSNDFGLGVDTIMTQLNLFPIG